MTVSEEMSITGKLVRLEQRSHVLVKLSTLAVSRLGNETKEEQSCQVYPKLVTAEVSILGNVVRLEHFSQVKLSEVKLLVLDIPLNVVILEQFLQVLPAFNKDVPSINGKDVNDVQLFHVLDMYCILEVIILGKLIKLEQ